jgi:hypothetical protein
MRLAKTEAQTAEKIAVLRRAALSKKATAPRKAAPATTAVTPRSATPARNSAATRKAAPARKTVTPQSATPAKKRAGPRRAAPAKKASVPTTAARKRRASHNHPKNQGEFDRAEYERHPEAISQQSTKQPPLELTQATAPSKAVAVMLSAMNWAYDTANNAGLGIDSASNMARKYLAHGASADEAIDSLIRWQVTYAGTAGFVTNVGAFGPCLLRYRPT